jgi:hypothetical protein
LQNGHYYYHNNYDLPSNEVIVYSDSDKIIRDICGLSEDVEESEVAELNATYNTDYTCDEVMTIRCAIHDSVNAVQALVNDSIAEYELNLVTED